MYPLVTSISFAGYTLQNTKNFFEIHKIVCFSIKSGNLLARSTGGNSGGVPVLGNLWHQNVIVQDVYIAYVMHQLRKNLLLLMSVLGHTKVVRKDIIYKKCFDIFHRYIFNHS
ncbi:hypothetical protein RIR_jg32511.t1 [Rhizophagus irregularis DAOM 181602=DAOM 197198]|uniref:Uncharacterized protein n=1 Tax=Rhizophagus irregularis (strain DAOM 181602 / DAOM 197198 / MUCL 43194) TaxID=747089 RepID=U9SWB5_RHIID|nr:hypothetical protein RIR_jg32511.t1 [Rhizophagus irregularis DAOM 181602=DAOM 197198]